VRDIREGSIRVLHGRSYIDDPTRIFRAVRFETRLGFRIVADDEARIAEALTLGLLETLEEYRIAAERRRILREADCARAGQRLAKLGVLDALEGLRRNRRSLGRPLAKIGQILAAARR
jgi:tRNA nucleotidyltransferase (CCA-adding enzyme)